MSEDLGEVKGYRFTLTTYDNDGKVIHSEKIEVKL